jgi:PadR family transcriptional regulator AphA
MSLRHAVLGLLASHPANGYELTQRFDRSLANAWTATHSQIYPELAKLEEAGMVEVIGEGPRRSRTFAVTDAGRAEVRRWLMETEPRRGQRNESAVRFFLAFLLEPEDRRAVFERELRQVRAQQQELLELTEKVKQAPQPQPFAPTIDLGLRINPVMQAWLEEQIEQTRR